MRLTHKRSWQFHLAFCAAQLIFAWPFVLTCAAILSWSTFAVTVSAVVLLGNTALFGHQIYFAATQRRDFFCGMESDRIRCDCPIESSGSSFNLLISDITSIAIDDGRVTLRSSDGGEFWLTSNYGNPAIRFVDLLVKANPAIELDRR